MRCLYCGGELALFKKLRGGGGFCSEAHRQKYQEEYSQLALSRLLQANPRVEKRPAAPRTEAPQAPSPSPAPAAQAARTPAPAAQAVRAQAPSPAADRPAPCGFLLATVEAQDCAMPLFSEGPLPFHGAQSGAQQQDHATLKALPRAEQFRFVQLRFALKNASPAAPEPLEFEAGPEFKETAGRWLIPLGDEPRVDEDAASRPAASEPPGGSRTADASAAASEPIPEAQRNTDAVPQEPVEPVSTRPRQAVKFMPVRLRLAPPPNSGAQDVCRPAPFPPAAPALPVVQMNPLRPRFGFEAAPESRRATERSDQESAAAPEPALALGVSVEKRNRLPLILSVAGALILVGGGAAFLFTRGNGSPPAAHRRTHAAPAPIAETDWSTDWSGKPTRGERFSILLPSLKMSDYRIEFQGQIESKSLGWIFRAADPNNYYALRLEIAKPGPMADIALTRTVVEEGQPKDRARIPLRKKFARDTVFKIRTDVEGSTFRTWIQGELVDAWSDGRFKTGAFGLLTDAAGRAKLQMIQLSEPDDRTDATARGR